MPIDLREYFTGFPTSTGATHILPEGFLCGAPVKFEIPIKHHLNRVNWGGPSRTTNWQSASGRMETWHYNVYGIKGFRHWSIIFPAKYVPVIRSTPGF